MIQRAWFAPPPRFARELPVSQSSQVSPGQPEPSPPTAVLAQPRWVGCPADGQLHLLLPVGVAAAASEGFAHALCGRRIPAAALMLRGHSEGLCVSCLAEGFRQRVLGTPLVIDGDAT